MATRAPSRSSASRKPPSSTKGKSARSGAKKAPAKRPAKAAPPRSADWDRRRDDARRQLRGHGPDAAAIVLLIVGVLTAIGLVSDAAGGIGHGLASVSGALFGLARYAVPVVTIGLAVLCFFWRPGRQVPLAAVEAAEVSDADGLPEGYAPRAPWRVGLGLGLLCVAGLGILDLATGAPKLDAPLDELRDAAGLVGALIGAPLVALAGTAGAAVILGGIALLGALLVPGIPMRDVLGGFGRALRWAGRHARSFTEIHPPAEGDDAIGDYDAAVDAAGGVAEPPPGFRDEARLDDPDDPDDLVDVAAAVAVLDEPEPREPEAEAAPEAAPVLPVVTLYDVEADATAGVPVVDAGPGKQLAIDLGPAPKPGHWKLPSANILKKGDGKGVERRFVEEGGRVLEAALHQHGVDAKLIGMTVGPTVTRYELELAPGVKVNRVTGLSHDIAYAMASPDVRILAPIPGRSAIGVEVPNRQRQLVTLGDILTSKEAKEAKHPLEVGLGRGIDGKPVMSRTPTSDRRS